MTTFAHEDEICADFEVSDKKLIEMKSSKLKAAIHAINL
jgi:hypothetical protein